jgi:hypothetical protein
MRILVVYSQKAGFKNRKTIDDSLFCFGKYLENVYYLNYLPEIEFIDLNKLFGHYKFDAIIYHYTFMCLRLHDAIYWNRTIDTFKRLFTNSVQIMSPQDEYYQTDRLREFINAVNIDIVLTLASKKCARKLYPSQNTAKFVTVLPGYINEETMSKINELSKTVKRDIDIGYRARKLSYSLGKHALIKTQIAEIFNEKLKGYPNITADILNTGDEKNVFFGFDWYKFLLRSRTMLGCMGGASIIDSDGKWNKAVELYLNKKPKASFEYVMNDMPMLKSMEGSLDYTAISPRCFEMAMTKTCQILVGHDYGIMKPGVHYIELYEDYSNVDDILKIIQDKEYCDKIADNAYKELYLSRKYSYRRYTKKIENLIKLVHIGKYYERNFEGKSSKSLYFILYIYNHAIKMMSFIKNNR